MKKIRIWKLGSLEHKVVPSAESMAKLEEILNSQDDGGELELIWGPDIDTKEIVFEDNEDSCIMNPDLLESFIVLQNMLLFGQHQGECSINQEGQCDEHMDSFKQRESDAIEFLNRMKDKYGL